MLNGVDVSNRPGSPPEAAADSAEQRGEHTPRLTEVDPFDDCF